MFRFEGSQGLVILEEAASTVFGGTDAVVEFWANATGATQLIPRCNRITRPTARTMATSQPAMEKDREVST